MPAKKKPISVEKPIDYRAYLNRRRELIRIEYENAKAYIEVAIEAGYATTQLFNVSPTDIHNDLKNLLNIEFGKRGFHIGVRLFVETGTYRFTISEGA